MTHADLILKNARILTMDAANPTARAIALGHGKILALGDEAQVLAHAGPATRIIDAGGRSLMPGFVESHLHLGLGGNELGHLQLGGRRGMDAMRAAFTAFAAQHPSRPVLMAQGADYGMLDHPVSRHDMDAIIADRPIAMMAHDHHTVWANSAALRAAGILHGADMPAGHEVVMGADGMATGELREFEAFAPVIALAGETRINLGIATGMEPSVPPTAAERAADKEKFAAGLRHCAAHGITSMVNMDGNRYTLDLLREMQAEGNLLARVKVPFHFKPTMPLSDLERASSMARDFNDEWLSSGFVKMFMDGVVDSRTAYMLNDYPDQAGHRSEPLLPPELFNQVATEIDRRGLQIAVHAIGDGAVRTTIDGYEAAQRANGQRDARHRIEHIELIDRADIPRLAALGITASLQPPHPPGAMEFPLMPTLERIGKDRLQDAYLWGTLAKAGAHIAYASDWPVTDVSVTRGIKAALTRTPYDGCGDERLSLMETLRAYTAGGAWAAHMDHITGTLAVGLAGDIVVLDGDIETTPAEKIDDIAIALTICGGRITYEGGMIAV